MKLLRCADSGLLIELEDLDEVQSWYATLSETPLEGVTALVPAARTILVQLDPERADVTAV